MKTCTTGYVHASTRKGLMCVYVRRYNFIRCDDLTNNRVRMGSADACP